MNAHGQPCLLLLPTDQMGIEDVFFRSIVLLHPTHFNLIDYWEDFSLTALPDFDIVAGRLEVPTVWKAGALQRGDS